MRDRFVVGTEGEATVVTSIGRLYGERLDGTSFEDIRYVDVFVLRDGVITEPTRIFAPGFGAGAVAGYAVLRLDPAVVAVESASTPGAGSAEPAPRAPTPGPPASADMQVAFG